MNRIWYCKISHIFPGLWRVKQSLEQPHEKERPCFAAERGLDRRGHIWTLDGLEEAHDKNGPVLLQNVAWAAWAHKDPGSFRAVTRKERPCFAAECGPDPFGHTRALQGLFSDPTTQNLDPRSPEGFRAATRNERRGPRDWYCKISHIFPGLWRAKQSLEQPHEKNGPVLLQNVASTAVNVAATPLGTHEHSRVHFSILRLRTQLRATTRKRTALFCCRM